MSGEWMLKDEKKVCFWIYHRTWSWWRRRWVTSTGYGFGDEYLVFWIDRTWYSTATREFLREREEIRTFAEVLDEGKSIYDWRNQEMVHPPADR